MKIRLLISLLLMGFVGFVQAATDYETDEQYFYVDETLNEALESANFVVCVMSSMRPDAFVNDGNYLATVNLDGCLAQEESQLDDAAKAEPVKPEDKNKQAAGDSGSQGERKDQKAIMESLLNVTRNSTTDPVITKAWLFHNESEMAGKVYSRIKQTAGVSKDAPNGEFEMHWTVLAGESHPQMPEDEFQAWGYLNAEGSTISMIEQSWEYASKFTATYADNGNIEGAFATELNGSVDDDYFYQGFYKFHINVNDKSYCKNLLRVEKKSLKPVAQKGDLYITQLVNSADYKSLGIEPGEHCFSTKRSEATRNVFNYGVYNQDGSSLDIGLTDMALQAEITDSDGDKVNVYAHADTNNVWVDYEYADLIDENTVFEQEFYDDEQAKSDKTYRLKRSQISVQKYQAVRVSLNSLDNMPFEIDGFTVGKNFRTGISGTLKDNDYLGVYDANAGKFILTHMGTYTVVTRDDEDHEDEDHEDEDHEDEDVEYEYSRQKLDNALEISISSIANNMSQNDSFDLYFPNSQSSYRVNKQALENPADNNQVKTKVVTMVSLSEMQDETLFCVHDCVTAAKVNETFEEVKKRLLEAKSEDEDKDKSVKSPYVELNDSIDLDDLVKYKFANNKIYNPEIEGNAPVFRDNLLNDLLGPNDDYYDKLSGIKFPDSWTIAWGFDVGVLVNSSEINKFKCPQDGSKYCLDDRFWAIYDEIDTYYIVRYEVEPNFELFTESGESVKFVAPKTLFYTLPKGEDEQSEEGSRFALDYFGHGQLWGIPDYVYDTATGTELGEYTYEWKESYRHINRFTIPDGAELVDDKNKKYKVKALFGAAWLKNAPEYKGKYTYSGNIEQIPSDDKLFIKDGLDAFDTIGAIPKDNIINNAKPSVIDGQIIYDPTPNAQ